MVVNLVDIRCRTWNSMECTQTNYIWSDHFHHKTPLPRVNLDLSLCSDYLEQLNPRRARFHTMWLNRDGGLDKWKDVVGGSSKHRR